MKSTFEKCKMFLMIETKTSLKNTKTNQNVQKRYKNLLKKYKKSPKNNALLVNS